MNKIISINHKFGTQMGNSFIFPVPKCTYTSKSLSQFYLEFPIYRRTKDSRSNNRKQVINVPALHLRSHTKSKYLFIYAHGNSEDLGRLYFSLLDYYERFQVLSIICSLLTLNRSIFQLLNTRDTDSTKGNSHHPIQFTHLSKQFFTLLVQKASITS